MSREQLIEARAQVADKRPGLGLPLAVLIVPPVVSIPFLVVGVISAGSQGGADLALAMLSIGSVLLVSGIVVGIILLAMRSGDRQRYGVELDVIDEELESRHHRVDRYVPPSSRPAMITLAEF